MSKVQAYSGWNGHNEGYSKSLLDEELVGDY